jgi:prolyl-tRNA editing enzyme YbaK/EbsC (Cys-tRNA(Pro) deacylase)
VTPDSMREYLAVHAPELKAVELTEAHTTEYISREWKVLPAQVAKGHMMPGSEASEITGLSSGRNHAALPRFRTARSLRHWLNRFEEVVTAGGSAHAAIRIPLTRFAQLTGATWVDVCKKM